MIDALRAKAERIVAMRRLRTEAMLIVANREPNTAEETLKPSRQTGGREGVNPSSDERNLTPQPVPITNVSAPVVNVAVDAPQVNIANTLMPSEVVIHHAAAPIVNVAAPSITMTPTVQVTVDTQPIAMAVEGIMDVIKGVEEMMSQVLQMMAGQPPIKVISRPRIEVQPTQVTVENPKREKRSMKIKHSDGTESTVTEQ